MRGNESEHLILIERDSFAGGEVVGAYYHFIVSFRAVSRRACKVSDHPIRNILNVGGARLHIRVVHRGEHLSEVIGGKGYCVLGVYALAVDDIFYRLVIIVVLEHHHVYLEDLRVSFADLFKRLFVYFPELFSGGGLSLRYPFLFLFGILNAHSLYCRVGLFEN